MNMNRRSFFRFFGRATGTAAAVVVGGAALLPKVKDLDIQPDGAVVSFVKQAGDWDLVAPLNEVTTAHWKVWNREMLASAKRTAPIF